MFAGFENTLANIETKMGGRKGEQQGFRRYLKKPKERRKSEALGRIEKKPKESKKTRKTEDKHIIKPKCVRVLKYVDIRQ